MKSFRTAASLLAILVLAVAAATTTAAHAQTFTKLVDFNGTNGAGPLYDSLVQGRDGNLYGPTSGGGVYGYGTVFKITAGGTLTTLHSFQGADGAWPYGGLLLDTNGNFYGTTEDRGTCQDDECDWGPMGTVFKITPEGKLTTLYNFEFGDGAHPRGALVQGTEGDLYGTTNQGGDSAYDWAHGEVFKITPEGELAQLHVFEDYAYPNAGLVQATDGSFYGTARGGSYVFEITPRGALTDLHDFDCSDGCFPEAALVEASDGKLYGTTEAGGTSGCGTIFRITPNGKLRTLHNFDGTDGCSSYASVLQATDGNLYGTTSAGGANNHGTVFKITIDGTLTTLHSFQGVDGDSPVGGLVQATDGKLYGTTSVGGAYGDGTIFSLDVGLGPLVRLVRNVGRVGGTGGILGQGFTGTTGVSLNGTPAGFTVVSDTYLTATVPVGGTTGYVTVTTPSGTLTSSKIFRVTPQLLNFDPPSGPVGTQVTITGVSFTQTTGVGFGDYVPATFTVNSNTQVTATVPIGAKTGRVGVQTLGGIARSSGSFTVTP